MSDAHANFAVSTVATAPSPATSGTSLVVASGEGARFPAVPFNAVVCPPGATPTPANAEVIRATARSTDTFGTIVRAQEGSTARSIQVGDRIFAGITAKTLTDVESIPQSLLQVYVDYVNGNDSNNGRSWANAYKTIQAAYDALKTYAAANYTASPNGLGIGRIHLAPGDHQIGAGLLFDSFYPVELQGTRSGWNRPVSLNSQSRLVSNSATATEFVLLKQTVGAVGYSATFNQVAFHVDSTVNTALTAVIRAVSIDYLEIRRCVFDNGDNTVNFDIPAVQQQGDPSHQDQAWMRLEDNRCNRLQLYHGQDTNLNRSVIAQNIVFYGGTLPMIHLEGDFRASTVSSNNLEGDAVGIKVDSGTADSNVFINNSGEAPTNADVFMDFTGSISGSVIIAGDVNVVNGTNGTYVQFGTTTAGNVYIGAGSPIGESGRKLKVIDNSTNANGNRTFSTRHGLLAKYKSGAGVVALADADYNSGPPANGSWGFAYNSTTSRLYLSARGGGVWKSVELTL